MHVALVQLPFPILPEEPRHASPPLGLALMAATLGNAGRQTHIVDAVLEGYDCEWIYGSAQRAYGLEPASLAERLHELQPNIIGISCLFSTQDGILRSVVPVLREKLPRAVIVLGGTHPTVFAREMVQEGLADFVVKGEGELAIVAFARAIEDRSPFTAVPGLVWLDGGIVRENKVERIADLDSLPLPARDQLDLTAYSRIGIMHGETRRDIPATTIMTSRGCPANCSFCSIHPVWGHRFRAASIERVMVEIAELYHRYGVRHLLVEDDNFTFDMDRAKALLTAIGAEFPDLSWSAPNGVAIWRLDEELVDLIARTNCRTLSLAVESGCPDTLKRLIGKPLSLGQVHSVVSACRRHGIRTTAFFVLGLPGESRAAMAESMDFASSLDVDTLSVMTAVPLPGSPLYEMARAQNLFPADIPFTEFSTRNPVLTTIDFNPELVDRLARQAMMRHAMRHPFAYLRRAAEKAQAAPGTTLRSIARYVTSSLRIGV